MRWAGSHPTNTRTNGHNTTNNNQQPSKHPAHKTRPGQAHPRSRGENIKAAAAVVEWGSSPLTRRKRRQIPRQRYRHGLIPAHAGKTGHDAGVTRVHWAHPRSRGENERDPYSDETLSGSSPLTRGKRCAPALMSGGSGGSSPLTRGKRCEPSRQASSERLIPAHAGKTQSMRGYPEQAQGSSPLTRGKHVREITARDRRGLIPAHAGKTSRRKPTPSPSGAHPRSRGENTCGLARADIVEGSSPLTRGKLRSTREECERPRLIPAHAGKTASKWNKPSERPAHPRSRGENDKQRRAEEQLAGSSPLTRGKPNLQDTPAMKTRLIPAHAGKTTTAQPPDDSDRAHPRSRGENTLDETETVEVLGSSPLTRGKPAAPTWGAGSLGLIPAHAGKTSSGIYILTM